MDAAASSSEHAAARVGAEMIERARALAPLLEAAGPRIDADRELPPDVVDALHEAGLYRMLFPRTLGGLELPLPLYLQVIEELAKANASTAWCVGQSSVCSTLTAYLESAVASEMFGKDRRALLNWGPQGRTAKAIIADGGYRVTGRWPFASGSRHATYMAAHSGVYEADGVTAHLDKNGNPEERTFIFPRTSVEIIDNWHVMGLKGTGSDSYTINDLFVPTERSLTVFGRNPAERRVESPLYLFSVHQVFGASFAAVSLGIARSMLDAYVDLAKSKMPAVTGGNKLLRDNALVQSQIGFAQSQLATARVFLLHALEEAWDEAVDTGSVSLDGRVRMRMASAHAAHLARQIVDTAYHGAGATAIFENNPFERRFRDAHTVSQQVQSHFAVFEIIGRHFLDLPIASRLI